MDNFVDCKYFNKKVSELIASQDFKISTKKTSQFIFQIGSKSYNSNIRIMNETDISQHSLFQALLINPNLVLDVDGLLILEILYLKNYYNCNITQSEKVSVTREIIKVILPKLIRPSIISDFFSECQFYVNSDISIVELKRHELYQRLDVLKEKNAIDTYDIQFITIPGGYDIYIQIDNEIFDSKSSVTKDRNIVKPCELLYDFNYAEFSYDTLYLHRHNRSDLEILRIPSYFVSIFQKYTNIGLLNDFIYDWVNKQPDIKFMSGLSFIDYVRLLVFINDPYIIQELYIEEIKNSSTNMSIDNLKYKFKKDLQNNILSSVYMDLLMLSGNEEHYCLNVTCKTGSAFTTQCEFSLKIPLYNPSSLDYKVFLSDGSQYSNSKYTVSFTGDTSW